MVTLKEINKLIASPQQFQFKCSHNLTSYVNTLEKFIPLKPKKHISEEHGLDV